MSDFSISSITRTSLVRPLSLKSNASDQINCRPFTEIIHLSFYASLSVLLCLVFAANASAKEKITNLLSDQSINAAHNMVDHSAHSHGSEGGHQSDITSFQSWDSLRVQANFQQRGNDRRGRANNRTRSQRAAQRGQRSRANRGNRNNNRGTAQKRSNRDKGKASERRRNPNRAQNRGNAYRGQNAKRRPKADRNPNRGQSARPQNRGQNNRGQRARNGNRGQQGVAPRNRDRRVDNNGRRGQRGQNNRRRNRAVDGRANRRGDGVRSDNRRRGNRGASHRRRNGHGVRGNGHRSDRGFRNSRRAHKNGVRRSHRRSKRLHHNRGFRHTGYSGFHRSGFAILPFTGVRYGHGLRSSHRGGHGYFCSDHSVFHYFLGFDPLGFSRISTYGRSNYRYSKECYPVEKVGYHKGRKALLEAILCYDSFNYPYIKKGSTYVVEYY